MSRRIAVSMRVSVSGHGERRDALAQDWAKFLGAVLPGCLWIPIPNIGSDAVALVTTLGLDGLLLTGGEDWGTYPERDRTEAGLFAWATDNGYPVGGICRGMQVINLLLGGELAPVQGHVAVRHAVRFSNGTSAEVNSFHSNGVLRTGLSPELIPTAVCGNEEIEAFTHQRHPIFGVMWHPEREQSVAEHDRLLFQNFFCGAE